MDGRQGQGRGRGGHWRRGGGAGDIGSGENRGRGRGGHHRGRGKRDHHRGRGRERERGPAADFRRNQDDHDDHDDKENLEEEVDNTFSRRKLESNWDRYKESEREELNEDVPAQRGTDYHVLLTSAGDSFTQFRLSDEKDWEMDSLAKNQIPALFVDLPALAESLQKLPLYTRLNLDPELVQETTPVELPSVTAPHKADSTVIAGFKAPQADRQSGLGVSCPVKSVQSTTPSQSLSTGVQPSADDAEEELDLLLNLQKPVAEFAAAKTNNASTEDETLNSPMQASAEEEKSEQKVDVSEIKPDVEEAEIEPKTVKQEVTEEDLEDWLDSMIS